MGPEPEQRVTGSWAGHLCSYTKGSGTVWRAEQSPFSKGLSPGPCLTKMTSSLPGALKPALPVAGGRVVRALLPAPLPRPGWNLRQARK